MSKKNQSTSAPKLISLRSADKLPRGIICDVGFKILGTPLAFKGSKNPGLLFYSDLDMAVPRGTKRAIGNAFCMRSLSAKKRHLDSIAVSYERMFKLGKMDLRLLPSGMGPGASMLEIKFNNKSIVYTSGIRLNQSLTGEQIQPVACDILLVDFPAPATKAPAPKTVKPKFTKWLEEQKAKGIASAVNCSNAASLFDVLSVLSQQETPVIAHRSVYNLLRDTEFQTSSPRHICRLGSKWPSEGVVVSMHKPFEKTAFANNADIPKCLCGPADNNSSHISYFPFGETAHVADLIKYAKQCGVHTVAISPSGTEQTADAFKKAGFTVFFSKKPQQLKLPL